MNFKTKLVSAAATAAMMAAVVAPASFAATNTVTVKNNGPFSYSSIKVKNWNNNSVTQGNLTSTTNEVVSMSNTGKNSSSFNVGGTNTITTGNVVNKVTITNDGNTNINNGLPCGCDNPSANTVTVSGNGAFSSNHVTVVNGTTNTVSQYNYSETSTGVMTGSNTGGNSSSFNVGGGTTTTTGTVTTTVTVTNGGSANVNGPVTP